MKKSLNILFIFFITLFVTSKVYPQNNSFDSLIVKGIDHIYNIEFEEAKIVFDSVRINYPQHPAGFFFDAMIIWWQILLNLNNEDLDDKFYDKLEEVVDMCDDILDEDEENIDAYFFKGGSLGFRARLLAIRESWLDAALDGKEALPLVFEAYALDSTNIDVQLGFGIYNYYASVIPEHFEFVKPLMIFFPEGNKDEGLRQLKLASESGKYSKTEATYFLMTSYYSYEEQYSTAHIYVDKLINEYPQNPVFHRYKGRIFIRQGNYADASKIFFEILNRNKQKLNGYNSNLAREAYYYIAGYYRSKNELDSALINYKSCNQISKQIDLDEESGFQVNAALASAKIYLEKGDTLTAKTTFEEVLDMREYRDSHEKAEKYIESLEE